MNGLSLPLLATTTGGRNPDRYCPACLDSWQRSAPEERRARIHPACRDVLQTIQTPAREA